MITYKILQIKDIANTDYAFRPYKPGRFNIEDYEVRFTGEAQNNPDTEICDALFHFFNTGRPEGFTGHSLSMSDVIQLESNGKTRLYYCDMVGWVRIA